MIPIYWSINQPCSPHFCNKLSYNSYCNIIQKMVYGVLSMTRILYKMLALMIPLWLGVNRSKTLKIRIEQFWNQSLELKRYNRGA